MNRIENKWESLLTLFKAKFQFALRERSLTWSVQSAYLAIPKSNLQGVWEEFFPKSSQRRQIPVWWDYFFFDTSTIRFEEAVSAHSYIEFSFSWSCKAGISSLFFGLAQKKMEWEEHRWEAIISEFSEFVKNPSTWNRYYRFPFFNKNLFPANEFTFDWSLVWITTIPYAVAKEFPLSKAIPASFEKSDAKFAITHSHLTKAIYNLHEVDYKSNVWLRDYFLQVRSQDNHQESDTYYLYVGSEYSHIEIENLCCGMKLFRKKLVLNTKITFRNPKIQLTFGDQHLEFDTWKKDDRKINSGSRFSTSQKILIPSEQSFNKLNSIYLLPVGIYKLDPNLLDLIPIE